MRFATVFGHYFIWHYGRAIRDLTRIYRNLIAFTFGFFSVSILVNSYLAPWRRLGEDYPEHNVDPFAFLSVLMVNIIMRLVGIFMRTIVIVLGMATTVLVIISYPLVLVIWIVLPFVVVITFFIGFGLLFR
ncbi:MAG: hypothetical protein NT041_01660 [Candidatus Vogelbacteria bacterium]|nr:hypothetical protein [Candidatus Vogelbacteria bacterium]